MTSHSVSTIIPVKIGRAGYKNHSGVLKRIRKIGEAYEAYTGVDYGFEGGKITG